MKKIAVLFAIVLMASGCGSSKKVSEGHDIAVRLIESGMFRISIEETYRQPNYQPQPELGSYIIYDHGNVNFMLNPTSRFASKNIKTRYLRRDAIVTPVKGRRYVIQFKTESYWSRDEYIEFSIDPYKNIVNGSVYSWNTLSYRFKGKILPLTYD
ncbi:MAG: hypothetical protein K2H10_07050 [Bacteroidales bacterium]|nr:hypothetical protein [Bacteroidales bacterium]